MVDTFVLIDPPVSAYDEPRDIRAWLKTLREGRREAEERNDRRATRSYDDAIAQAERWLERSLGRGE